MYEYDLEREREEERESREEKERVASDLRERSEDIQDDIQRAEMWSGSEDSFDAEMRLRGIERDLDDLERDARMNGVDSQDLESAAREVDSMQMDLLIDDSAYYKHDSYDYDSGLRSADKSVDSFGSSLDSYEYNY